VIAPAPNADFWNPQALAAAAVIGIPDECWCEAVGAIVRAAPGATVSAAELVDERRACRC
jgi:acyl-coenzyme A synthetase/AMP-(fatty) acid ligase